MKLKEFNVILTILNFLLDIGNIQITLINIKFLIYINIGESQMKLMKFYHVIIKEKTVLVI